MSGRYITNQQAKLYMKYRQEHQLNQDASAAKSGISVRSGYTIEQGKHHTQRTKSKRQHKTRTSPIDQVWEDDLAPMLEGNPDLQPTTLFIYLERTYHNSSGEPLYKQSVMRTLQRRVANWKAQHGPAKPVYSLKITSQVCKLCLISPIWIKLASLLTLYHLSICYTIFD